MGRKVCRAFARHPWLDGTCHFPSPGLRGNVISFSRTLTPSFSSSRATLRCPGSVHSLDSGLGIKEVWHERHEHHDFFMASQHPKLFPFFFILLFSLGVTSTVYPWPSAPCCLPLFCVSPQPHFCMGQALCYVRQNLSFLAGKGKNLVFVAIFFPICRGHVWIAFCITFRWVLGDLTRAGGTALLGTYIGLLI